jgi:hypothetical protein
VMETCAACGQETETLITNVRTWKSECPGCTGGVCDTGAELNRASLNLCQHALVEFL